MTDFLTSFTALPNLHPAVVHFPIALVLTALALEGASLVLKRQVWLERASALLYAFATASAGAAYLAGRNAADTVGVISARAEAVLADHSDLALWTLIVLAVAAVIRVAASARDRKLPASRLGALRAAGVLTALVAAALVVRTADLGGSLVFRHGVAVVSSAPEVNSGPGEQPVSAGDSTSSKAAEYLELNDDGSLDWQPDWADPTVLGTILHPAKGGTLDAVRIDGQTSADEPGFRLEVNGRAVLCFPQTFGDVVVDALVDLSDFQGTVGLGHHIQSVDDGVFFFLDSSGQAVLTRRQGGGGIEFDRAQVEDLPPQAALSTSVAGRHLKGQVNGQVVVHGHGPSGDAGQIGILVDGRGGIVIERITVTPVTGE